MDTIYRRSKTASADSSGEADFIDVAPCTMAVLHGIGKFRTVVGGGISVCLFDVRSRIAGMNHFIFPRTTDPRMATGRYGNVACFGLLEMMLQEGASFPLVAHISGGAYCDEFELETALDNIHFTWRYLLLQNIHIVSQHLGGRHLQEVVFDSATGTSHARPFRQDVSTGTGRTVPVD